jgi:hypothetical protein
MIKFQKITLAVAAGIIGAYIGLNLGLDVIWWCSIPKAAANQTIVLFGPDDDTYGFSTDCLQGCEPINLQGIRQNGGIRIDQNITYSY